MGHMILVQKNYVFKLHNKANKIYIFYLLSVTIGGVL